MSVSQRICTLWLSQQRMIEPVIWANWKIWQILSRRIKFLISASVLRRSRLKPTSRAMGGQFGTQGSKNEKNVTLKIDLIYTAAMNHHFSRVFSVGRVARESDQQNSTWVFLLSREAGLKTVAQLVTEYDRPHICQCNLAWRHDCIGMNLEMTKAGIGWFKVVIQ